MDTPRGGQGLCQGIVTNSGFSRCPGRSAAGGERDRACASLEEETDNDRTATLLPSYAVAGPSGRGRNRPAISVLRPSTPGGPEYERRAGPCVVRRESPCPGGTGFLQPGYGAAAPHPGREDGSVDAKAGCSARRKTGREARHAGTCGYGKSESGPAEGHARG